MNDFSLFLDNKMREENISALKLSKEINCDVRMICGIRKGKYPNLELAVEIADYFGYDILVAKREKSNSNTCRKNETNNLDKQTGKKIKISL